MAKAELSVLVQALHGKAGNVVFVDGPDGTHVIPHVKPTDPQTAPQIQVRTNLRKAAGVFKSLTPTQNAAWKNYAASTVGHDRADGSTFKRTAMAAFMQLACKFLQYDPDGTVPVTPPSAPFYGDDINVTVTGGANKLTFTASAANSANVTTELLLQPLASANRKPQKNAYRHSMFKQFASGSLTQDVDVPAGYFASGYRFVNTQTGQDTALQPLSVQTVSFEVALGGSKESKKAA